MTLLRKNWCLIIILEKFKSRAEGLMNLPATKIHQHKLGKDFVANIDAT